MNVHESVVPPRELVLRTPVHLLAFGFGTGLAPVAPGTFGTLVGLPFFAALAWLSLPAYGVATLLLFGAGCYLCGESARRLGVHDHGGIVFDEIVGFLIAAAPLVWLPPVGAASWALWLASAFALFRLFDIWKPWPIRWLDRSIGGGLGIMLDDAAAGLLAALLLALMRAF